MSLPPSLLYLAQPALQNRALGLLPLQPADVPPGAQVTGVAFTRTAALVPTTGLLPILTQGDPGLTAQSPPQDVIDLGPPVAVTLGSGAITWPYLSSPGDNVLPLSVNGAIPNAPYYVDFMFTSTPQPGAAHLVKPGVRLLLSAWAFFYGTGSAFGTPSSWALLRSFTLRENERLRCDWRELLGATEATSISPDALALVPMIPAATSLPPADYTVACVAVMP